MKNIIITFLFIITSFNIFALTEEEIYVEERKALIKFSLSNDINEIQEAIINRTGIEADLNNININWNLENNISENIIELMNKHNVNYSMAVIASIFPHVIVYRRHQDRLFSYRIYR